MPGSSAQTGDMNSSEDFALEPGAGLAEKTDLTIERRSRLDLRRFGRSGSYVAVRPFFDARLRRGLVCEWGRWGLLTAGRAVRRAVEQSGGIKSDGLI
jgi:hypothetical protein